MDKAIKHAPMAVFCLYLAKSLVISASLADASIVVALVALNVYFDWATNKKQLTQLEQKVTELEAAYAKDYEIIKNNLASLKMNSGIRSAFAQK